MIAHILQQDAKLINTSTDKYGDQIQTSETNLKCRFRYITGVENGTNAESLMSDAIIWFAPDAGVVEGNVIEIENKTWRIDRLIKARRLNGEEVQFLKAFVKAYSM